MVGTGNVVKDLVDECRSASQPLAGGFDPLPLPAGGGAGLRDPATLDYREVVGTGLPPHCTLSLPVARADELGAAPFAV